MKPKHKPDSIIISPNLRPQPEPHEVDAARILSYYLGSTGVFLQASAGYKTKTPDILIDGVVWEIKSPTGNSMKSTIKRQFKGLKQSRSLVIYTIRTKLDDDSIIQQVRKECTYHRIDRIKVITKTGSVIDILP